MSSRIFICAECGEEITAPIWFEGKPYGWSCIKKVCPTYKKTKQKKFISNSEIYSVKPYYICDRYAVRDKNRVIIGDPMHTEKVDGGYIYF